MLTKDDELLCHQIHSTFDHVTESDSRWCERTVFIAFDISGKLSLMTGHARYANRNIMDAYGMVTVEDKTAHVVRVCRELRPAPSDPIVGPYSYEVVEPLKRVRVVLEENEYGLSFDIEGEGVFLHEEALRFTRSQGRVRHHDKRYYQVGRPSGWLKVDGKTYEIDKERWRFLRDHSWGTRGNVAEETSHLQPPAVPAGGSLYAMGIFDFDKYLIHFAVVENWEGKRSYYDGRVFYPLGSEKEGEELTLVNMEHDFQFRSDIRVIKSGRVTLDAVDGSKRELSIRALTTYYPAPAGYAYYNDYISGMWKGPQYIDGFKLDITKPDVLKQISTLTVTETWCEVRCGDDVGYGNLEMSFRGKFPKYGYQS